MRSDKTQLRRLWFAVVAALLLLGQPGGATVLGTAGADVFEAQDKGDAEPGGCVNCCRRDRAAIEAPGCRRGVASEAPEGAGCCRGGRGQGPGMRGQGPGRGGRGHGGPGRAGQAGRPAVMQSIQALVHEHRHELKRTVQKLDNGVVTVTRAPHSEAAAEVLRRHVREMKQVLESGGHVRMWDPLFRELFDRAEEISMEIEELEDGMRVVEISEDPEVAALIRAHAHKVSEFIERGPVAVHEETLLPAGYGTTEGE